MQKTHPAQNLLFASAVAIVGGLALMTLTGRGNVLLAQKRAEQDRVIPIVVTGRTPALIKEGDRIPLTITIRNGFKKRIDFLSFATKPNPGNLELRNVSVLSIHREGEERDLILNAPVFADIALEDFRSLSPGLVTIPPADSGSIQTELTKWTVRGGWRPGRYQVSVRIREIRVDRFSSVTVDSELITFVVI